MRAIAKLPSFQFRKPISGTLVWWLRFFGVIAFVIILLGLPGPRHVESFRIDLRWLGLCMLLTIFQVFLETFVWQWLISMQRIPQPYHKTIVAYLASRYLGLVTPGHVGELMAAGYVTMNTGITFGYALSSVAIEKILHWIVVIGFGIWSLPLLADVTVLQGVGRLVWISIIALIMLLLGLSLWVFSFHRLTRKWQKFSPWRIDMTEFRSGMRQLFSLQLVLPLTLAAVAFILLFFQMDAVLRSLGIALPFILICKIMAISRIAARIVPISVVGFGSKDAAVILLLSQHGIELSVAISAALIFLMCSYLVTLVLSGLCWWIKPLVIRRASQNI